MGVPFWYDNEDAWNTLTVVAGGATAEVFTFKPCLIAVTGEIVPKFDIKEAAGKDGARKKYKGMTPAKPKVTWDIWNDELFQEYQRMVAAIRPRPGKKAPPSIDVLHPRLALYGLQKFDLDGIPFIRTNGLGIEEATLSLIEWFPEAVDAPAQKKPKVTSVAGGVPLNPEFAKGVAAPTAPAKPSETVKP